MKTKKELTPKQKNAIKLDIFPNLYSIVTFWATALMLIAAVVLNNGVIYKVVVLAIFVFSFAVLLVIERAIKVRVENSDKTEELKRSITKHARFAGYFGYVLLVMTVLFA